MRRDHRATVALMTAVMAPAFLVALAIITDAGFWLLGSTQLQIAADAAAMGAGQLLVNGTNTTTAKLTTAAQFEATNAATKLVGTMNAPTVTPNGNYTALTVVLTSQAPSYLAAVTRLIPGFSALSPPLLRATATSTYKGGPKACVLALATSGTNTIEVDNSGTLAATSCPIFDNSNGTPAIHATGSGKISESGAISGADIGAVGTISSDNGGSISAATVTQNTTAASNPNAGMAAPTVPNGTTTDSNNSYTSYGTFNLTPRNWNGDVTFGGNGNTITFAPGTYYVTNGSMTFTNSTVTFQSTTTNGVTTGVSFVLTGSTPGNFSWTNYSNSTNPIIAPSSGTTNGIAVYQGCNASGSQTTTFNGGSTLQMTGTLYAPCSSFTANNNAQLNAASGMPFSVIAATITVSGSAGVRTSGGTTASTNNAGPVLTQ